MKEMYSNEMPWWLKMLGGWRVNRDSIDFKWGFFAPRLGFDLMLNRGGYFDRRYAITICLIWGRFHIYLPFKTKIPESCDTPRYGIQIHSRTLWLHLGGKMNGHDQCDSRWVTWEFPFINYVHDSHEVECKDGSWVRYIGSWEKDCSPDGRYEQTFPYTYVLKSGEVQKRTATVYKERRQWHRKWLPFLKMRKENINVSFDEEVGEQTGSWKGGVVGTSHDMRPGESVLNCLRRMEWERKFT